MLTRNAAWPGPNHGARIAVAPRAADQADLLTALDAFLRRHRIGPRLFEYRHGLYYGYVERLRDGMAPKAKTVERLRTAMARRDREAGL